MLKPEQREKVRRSFAHGLGVLRRSFAQLGHIARSLQPTAEQRELAKSQAKRFWERVREFGVRLHVFLQELTPTLFLSSLMFRIARVQHAGFAHAFIGTFVKLYKVNLSEAEFERVKSYPDFAAFFTRALKPNARPLDPDPKMLISPVDGRVSQIGDIRNWSMVQAKGSSFTVEELIGSNTARLFHNGSFCTIYLAPHNYHRVHMPANGKLREWSYSPGKLFSVSTRNVDRVPKLFVRNERVCAVFDSDFGPLAIVLVGALFVGSIETAWAGRVTPPHNQEPGVYSPMSPVILLRGREMGRFNMGSTVILLAPPRMVAWRPHLQPGKEVRMGLSLGGLTRVK